jgi:hypothetical protein
MGDGQTFEMAILSEWVGDVGMSIINEWVGVIMGRADGNVMLDFAINVWLFIFNFHLGSV